MNDSVYLLFVSKIFHITRNMKGTRKFDPGKTMLIGSQIDETSQYTGWSSNGGAGYQGQTDQKKEEACKGSCSCPLHDRNSRCAVQIGLILDEDTKHRLIVFLQKNVDVFTWTPTDMP